MGVRIEPPIVESTKRNANDYRMNQRTEYVQSSGEKIPSDDEAFDNNIVSKAPLGSFCRIWQKSKHLITLSKSRYLNTSFFNSPTIIKSKSYEEWVAISDRIGILLKTSKKRRTDEA
jgi:hypothetical protein